jgi:aspartyl-tRNA(Asn)/glutamyl-tRNA(Gln) amidotransferase subunit C
MAITRQQVLHIASLAHLELGDAEIERLTRDLDSILEHIRQLSELDTSSVVPTTHVAVSRLPFVADQPEPTLLTETVLAEAPRAAASGFAVPAFVDET